MLVLNRKLEESVVIDGKTLVTVLSIDGNRVKLGISAPKDVVVDRLEVYELKNCKLFDSSLLTGDQPPQLPAPDEGDAVDGPS